MTTKQQFTISYRIARLIAACIDVSYTETQEMLESARSSWQIDGTIFWNAVNCMYNK